MTATAFIELKDLELPTQIGTYAVGAIIPKQHLLDLRFGLIRTLF